ncbi:hypothetical protein Scep_020739 [Stephania cephalantha]|uniref:Uncharacterized protein n=1 Tax=Stephania cephalantha TaxID=152367 RepID=A0AAP0IDN4_9MAGN
MASYSIQTRPLSLCILTHTLFTRPILRRAEVFHSAYDLAALIAIEFPYTIFLFLFSLLSTAGRRLSPSPPLLLLQALVFLLVPPLLRLPPAPSPPRPHLPLRLPPHDPLQPPVPRVVLLAFAYYAMAESESYRNSTSIAAVAVVVVIVVVYFALHVYITAWWHLASELLSDDVLHFSSSSPP